MTLEPTGYSRAKLCLLVMEMINLNLRKDGNGTRLGIRKNKAVEKRTDADTTYTFWVTFEVRGKLSLRAVCFT